MMIDWGKGRVVRRELLSSWHAVDICCKMLVCIVQGSDLLPELTGESTVVTRGASAWRPDEELEGHMGSR